MDPPPAFNQRDQTVRDQVNIAGNAGRVDRHIRRQHSILRAYTRGRLRAAGQLDAVAGRHASACAAAMHTVDPVQRHYELLPAVAHDLDLAPHIIAAAENLMAAFSLSCVSLACRPGRTARLAHRRRMTIVSHPDPGPRLCLPTSA